MKGKLEVKLFVNDTPFELSEFPEEFLAKTAVGAVSSLKGAKDIQRMELDLEPGDVTVVVNGEQLPLTPFTKDIIANTITGLVSSLKGVDWIESLKIKIKAL